MPGATAMPAATAVPRATAAPTRAPAPTAKVKIQKARFAMPTPDVESNRSWAGGWNYIMQHDVFAETLLRVDSEIPGKVDPLLAESWESSNDFKTWSFKLREGIPFQFGWGEFTAADVVHTFELVTREESMATLKGPAWDQATPEVVDDYNIKFHFVNPYLDGNRLFSRWAGDLIIMSKAQWDEQGLGAFDDTIQTSGTGPYQLTDRKLGESLSYERVPDGHWAYDVDFEEFEFVWAPESLTRMALLLSGEVHISQIERTLQPDAEARGMRVIDSTQEVVQTVTMILGQFFANTPEWPDIYTPGLPLDNINIRKALNIAIDRDAIKQEIYLGRASTDYRYTFHPNNEGWNPAWVENWEQNYGYNPDEARRLLAAEGYGPDNPLKIKTISTTILGSPELHDVIEATGVMWADVAIELEIEKLDFGSWLSRIRKKQVSNHVLATRNLPIRTTQEGVRIFYSNAGSVWGYNRDDLNEQYQCLATSADLAERDQCARVIGDILYDNYADIPMFRLNADVTVDPAYITDYVWPGMTSAGVSHFHEIKGVRE
jgi:ABC-type transport system substrate-binding protein